MAGSTSRSRWPVTAPTPPRAGQRAAARSGHTRRRDAIRRAPPDRRKSRSAPCPAPQPAPRPALMKPRRAWRSRPPPAPALPGPARPAPAPEHPQHHVSRAGTCPLSTALDTPGQRKRERAGPPRRPSPASPADLREPPRRQDPSLATPTSFAPRRGVGCCQTDIYTPFPQPGKRIGDPALLDRHGHHTRAPGLEHAPGPDASTAPRRPDQAPRQARSTQRQQSRPLPALDDQSRPHLSGRCLIPEILLQVRKKFSTASLNVHSVHVRLFSLFLFLAL